MRYSGTFTPAKSFTVDAAALILPFPDQVFTCELMKVLGGYNCVPARVKGN